MINSRLVILSVSFATIILIVSFVWYGRVSLIGVERSLALETQKINNQVAQYQTDLAHLSNQISLIGTSKYDYNTLKSNHDIAQARLDNIISIYDSYPEFNRQNIEHSIMLLERIHMELIQGYKKSNVVIRSIFADMHKSQRLLSIEIAQLNRKSAHIVIVQANQIRQYNYFSLFFLILLSIGFIGFVWSQRNKRIQAEHTKKSLEKTIFERTSEYREAQKEAELANRAKSDFLSNMSHEFRTPLNGILGFAQILKMNKDRNLTDNQIMWISQINSSGALLLELVNDVLDIAKIESGRVEYEAEKFQPREVFKECFDIIKPLAESKNISLQGLPETDRFVYVDRSKLKQVLLNLIGNAVKYNKNDGFVQLGCKGISSDEIEIYVKDNGVGIPKEDLGLIFEPFHRASEHAKEIEGTGVGLSIVKKNIELMGGRIEVFSTFGEGSCFTVILQAVKNENEPLYFEI